MNIYESDVCPRKLLYRIQSFIFLDADIGCRYVLHGPSLTIRTVFENNIFLNNNFLVDVASLRLLGGRFL